MSAIPSPSQTTEQPRKRLGDILVENGTISEAQLKEALGVQKADGGALGTVLKEMGLVSDQEILMALGSQMGMEVVDLENMEIPPDVIQRVSRMMSEVYNIIPIRYEEPTNTLVVAMANPMEIYALDDLRFMLDCNLRGAVSDETAVREARERLYEQTDDESIEELLSEIGEGDLVEIHDTEENIDESSIYAAANEAPVKKLLNLVLLTAIKDQASDIHFEPFEDIFKIRYRIDGALLEMKSPPRSLALPLISRIKVISHLNIAERRKPQDGRIPMNIAGKKVDLRVSTLPTMFGESVVIRVLDKSVVALDLHRLGMREEELDTFMDLIHKPNGIVLVTGPTGSGKTTTLYACLNAVNDISEKIITTEDPIEYELPGIIQVPINAEIGVTYASCLRAILRQDPDKVLVGEIRDRETAEIAIEAALTGHLVFSTLHTQDAPSTVARLVEMGVQAFLLAATCEAVIAQRLVRSICPRCKVSYTPTHEELYELNLNPEEMQDHSFYYGERCDFCKRTGYKGRSALYEVLRFNQKIRDLVIAGKSTEVLRSEAQQMGMRNLREAGLLKVFDGITTIDEVVRETLAND